jgi:hypothetical protein
LNSGWAIVFILKLSFDLQAELNRLIIIVINLF